MSFLNRLVNHLASRVAHEKIVEKLSNSPTFQQFAVRSAQAASDLAKKSANAGREFGSATVSKVGKTAQANPAKGIFSQLRDQLKKELEIERAKRTGGA